MESERKRIEKSLRSKVADIRKNPEERFLSFTWTLFIGEMLTFARIVRIRQYPLLGVLLIVIVVFSEVKFENWLDRAAIIYEANEYPKKWLAVWPAMTGLWLSMIETNCGGRVPVLSILIDFGPLILVYAGALIFTILSCGQCYIIEDQQEPSEPSAQDEDGSFKP